MIKAPTKEQCKDTGIIIGLFLLYFSIRNENNTLFLVTFIVLIFTIVYPKIFKYFAVVWFGFSHLLGTVMTKILLIIVFYLIVAPISLLRKMMNKDGMNLKSFKCNIKTLWIDREKDITREDLFKPF